MRRRKIAIIALAGVGLVLAGCSSGDGTTTPTAVSSATPEDSPSDEPSEDDDGGGSASGDLVGWAGEFCSVGAPLQEELAELSDGFEPDPEDPLGGMSEMFDRIGPAFEAAADAIEGIGPPPIDGGEEAFDALMSTFRSASEIYADLEERLADLDPADPNFQTELAEILSDVTPELEESGQVIDEVFNSQEMSDAFESAPECAGLDLGQ